MTAFWVEKRFYERAGTEKAIVERLRRLTVCNRINALSMVFQAQHGWLGAAFSAAELVTALYYHLIPCGGTDRVLLSKGHAAVIQYAALAGLGKLEIAALARYKEHDGPQAHTDIGTPGIDINSGSLGQTLSKAFGMAWRRNERNYVIVGDGELQEGQNFEALMSIAHQRLANVIPIIDRNFIQSDSQVSDIKKIDDLPAVLRGFGFNVIHIPDGNDMAEVVPALEQARDATAPVAVIADTSKGAGVSFMASKNCARRSYTWHGGVPSIEEYRAAMDELAAASADQDLRMSWREHRMKVSPLTVAGSRRPNTLSTGEAFAAELLRLAAELPELVVLDADLEKSCRLSEFAAAYPERFLEMGIAEQDMVSAAGGLALTGRLPAVNTYGSFMRRAFEQIYVNATERTRIIYAGHYSGLCYTTDGKTHQCTGDVAMMRSIPGMHVVYPAFPEELPGIFSWYLQEASPGPLYLRLHRTPPLISAGMPPRTAFCAGFGRMIRFYDKIEECILTSGPQMTSFCAAACDALMERKSRAPDVFSMASLTGVSADFIKMLSGRYRKIHVIEELDVAGGLFDVIAHGIAAGGNGMPELTHLAPEGFTFSSRDRLALYRHFGLTPVQLEMYLENSDNGKTNHKGS